MRRLMAAAGGVMVLSTPVLAAEKVIQEPDKIIVRKKSAVDFTDVNVEGELTRPDGAYVLDRTQSGFPSRVKVRASFTPELQKSVDNL